MKMDKLEKCKFLTKSPSSWDSNNLEAKYNTKIQKSFETKFDLYIFSRLLDSNNGDDLDITEFNKFVISEKLKADYAYVWQCSNNDQNKRFSVDISVIDNNMENWYKEGSERNNKRLKLLNEYKSSYENWKIEFSKIIEERTCYYCGIDEELMKLLAENNQIFKKHFTRGKSIEVDRKDSYEEYGPDNCIPCCYWCNNAKADEFSDTEFKLIAINITNVWNDRINKLILEGKLKDDNLITGEKISKIREKY